RRKFCAVVGAAGLSANAIAAPARPQKLPPLRVIAYNIYACNGWPETRPRAKKAVQEGQMARRMAVGLEMDDPDIINFSQAPSESLAKEVAEHLGMHHIRFPSGGNWPGTLLSRFEVIDSQNVPLGRERPADLFTRHWGRATLNLG